MAMILKFHVTPRERNITNEHLCYLAIEVNFSKFVTEKKETKILRLISSFLYILLKRSSNVSWLNIGLCSQCSDFVQMKTGLRRMLVVEMIMSYLRNKNQQDALFFLNLFQQSILYLFRIE
jgi:hypothetical protein